MERQKRLPRTHEPTTLGRLIKELARPKAYPHPAGTVTVLQTHISVVFLAGDFAYKLKKPVNLGFVDFSTPELRRTFCRREVDLNRRLAPRVYLSVEPIVRTPEGLRVGVPGPAIDHLVRMRRLPADRTLAALLERGEIQSGLLASLGHLLARFHAEAERGPAIARWARWDRVAANCRENFEQLRPFVERTVSRTVLQRLSRLTEGLLADRRALIEARAERGIPCDGHGDLRLDHVYRLAGNPPAADEWTIIDCIEFNDRFRYLDPIADLAFLIMDLGFQGRRDLSRCLLEAYLAEANDRQASDLLDLYVAYRAVVRGKVESLELAETEIDRIERARAEARARAHFLFALGTLAPPGERPCFILVAGLPGSGKTTLANGLARHAGLERISSDEVRKSLAGLGPGGSARAEFGQGLYTDDWNKRTYEACLQAAEQVAFQGGRVVIDASFNRERDRRQFIDAAARLAIPILFLHCEAAEETARRRLASRRGGASDADWAIRAEMTQRTEPLGQATAARRRVVSTDGPERSSLEQAMQALATAGLH